MEGWIVLGLGLFFILAGTVSYFWGRHEMDAYYLALSSRHDVREFLERSPIRPEPEALKIGGYICFGLGVLLVALSFLWR